MSHGIHGDEASKLIVNGFIEPIIKQLPMEYVVEVSFRAARVEPWWCRVRSR
jgi:Fe-S cluster assembly scaffold protein SufB